MRSSYLFLTDLLSHALRPFLGLALVCAGFSCNAAFRTTFWTRDYLPGLMQQAATNIVLAVGMTFVIITGGIDLSVGSVLALCGITLGLTVKSGMPWYLATLAAFPFGAIAGVTATRLVSTRHDLANVVGAITAIAVTACIGIVMRVMTAGGIQLEGALLITLLVGISCGLLNGLGITLGNVPPFVMTLGVLTAARGLTVYVTGGSSIDIAQRLWPVGATAPQIAISLGVVAIGSIILGKMRAGRYIMSIGGNEEASRLSGVNITSYKTLAYALSGLMAAIAAIMLSARFRAADTGAGMNAELNAIAAVVIGGTSLSGGRGSIIGGLVGALTIAVLSAGLVIVEVPATLQGVVIGAVIVGTVMVDQNRKRRA